MNAGDFPVDTLAHLQQSMRKFDYLLRDGQMNRNDTKQVLDIFGTYFDPKFDADAIVAPTGVYTGAAGTTTFTYVAIPNYPLNDPTGFQGSIKSIGGPPPYGRPSALAELEPGVSTKTDLRVRRYLGGANVQTAIAAATVAVANCAATLDATHYVTVTAPNPGTVLIPGVKYDICLFVSGSPNEYFLVASDVAPGGTAVDNGQAKPQYTFFAHSEVAYDSVATAVVYNVNTVLAD